MARAGLTCVTNNHITTHSGVGPNGLCLPKHPDGEKRNGRRHPVAFFQYFSDKVRFAYSNTHTEIQGRWTYPLHHTHRQIQGRWTYPSYHTHTTGKMEYPPHHTHTDHRRMHRSEIQISQFFFLESLSMSVKCLNNLTAWKTFINSNEFINFYS